MTTPIEVLETLMGENEEFLAYILKIIKTLNKIEKIHGDEVFSGARPYANFVPIILEDDLCGFITDQIGGTYSYHKSTEAEREWWDNAPWNRTAKP